MRAWPRAFEWEPRLRKEYVKLCELLTINGITREQWHPELDVWDADFVWKTANELLNL